MYVGMAVSFFHCGDDDSEQHIDGGREFEGQDTVFPSLP